MTVTNISSNTVSTSSYYGNDQGQSDRVDDAVATIEGKLNESWRDWDVSHGDLTDINRTLDGLNAENTNATIAAMSDGALSKWGGEIDGNLGGLSADERRDLFSNLASDLDATQLGVSVPYMQFVPV